MAINRVIIEGNLTRDVEMRATASDPLRAIPRGTRPGSRTRT